MRGSQIGSSGRARRDSRRSRRYRRSLHSLRSSSVATWTEAARDVDRFRNRIPRASRCPRDRERTAHAVDRTAIHKAPDPSGRSDPANHLLRLPRPDARRSSRVPVLLAGLEVAGQHRSRHRVSRLGLLAPDALAAVGRRAATRRSVAAQTSQSRPCSHRDIYAVRRSMREASETVDPSPIIVEPLQPRASEHDSPHPPRLPALRSSCERADRRIWPSQRRVVVSLISVAWVPALR
jgi:hypothetical protein